MSRKILAIIMALAMMLSLAACGESNERSEPSGHRECSHEWSDASCTEAPVCTKCGEVNGEALGHNWTEASCAAPETCSNCGETKGELASHSYDAWTRNEPDMTRTCSVCGDTETQPVDNAVLLNIILDGKWELEWFVDAAGSNDPYIATETMSMNFDSGVCTMRIPQIDKADDYLITEIEEQVFQVVGVTYNEDDKGSSYIFFLVAENGELLMGGYGTEDEMLVFTNAVTYATYILTKVDAER